MNTRASFTTALCMLLSSYCVVAAAQRVDSTYGSRLIGSPQTQKISPTSASLQNSSSKTAGAWSENMMNRPHQQSWFFNYSVISSDIDTVDGKVVVNGSVSFNYTLLEIVPTYVKLLRDGTLIKSWPVAGTGSPVPYYAYPESGQPLYYYTYGGTIPINWVDTPSVGRHTYEVQIQGGTNHHADWVFYFNGGSLALWQ